MIDHFETFLNEQIIRKGEVFYSMSNILRKRTPDQCRRHHQRLQLRCHDDLQAILKEVKLKIQAGLTSEEA